jgi:alanine racemase
MTMNETFVTNEGETCGLLTIDLAALCDNYRQLRDRVFPAITGAVVKADAYGLGADRLAPVLYNEGCRTFFVAHFIEALRLRSALPSDAAVFVLNGLYPGDENRAADNNIMPVLNSLDQVRNWSAAARARGQRLSAAIQIDTGMSRLGLPGEELEALLSDPAILAPIEVTHLVSHLASADDPADALNHAQLQALRSFILHFPDAKLSFANSGGIFLGADFHGSIVRPGVALYGGSPVSGVNNPMKPVVQLRVRVIQTRTVPAGAKVGYSGTYVTGAETRLATVGAGYADGIPRHLSDTGAAFYNNIRLPIVGRVSMDSMTLDISALPPGALILGDFVELIGEDQSLEDLAKAAGTISYEILTRLGQRYKRQYLPPYASAR